jgi:hypothetical protein
VPIVQRNDGWVARAHVAIAPFPVVHRKRHKLSVGVAFERLFRLTHECGGIGGIGNLLRESEDGRFVVVPLAEKHLVEHALNARMDYAHGLALTLPHWRECLRPIGARLAQTFRESLVNKNTAPRTLAAKSENKRRSVAGPERSPLLATPRKASQPRPYATRAWRAPTVEARPANPTACAICGEPVLKRRRRHCEECMPKARREHGLRAIEAARKALAAQTAAGKDPRRGAAVNRARAEAISDGHRRNRSWAREHPGQRDEAWFKREIAPRLDAFTLAETAAATGLSLAACSRIRAGARVPHPRYWKALGKLVRSLSARA